MKLLLTSGGVQNASIHQALLGLLGKLLAECSALAITTASYALPGGARMASGVEVISEGHWQEFRPGG